MKGAGPHPLLPEQIPHPSILVKHPEDPAQLTLTGRYHKTAVSLAGMIVKEVA
jgi:hypothetical protein